MDSRKRKHQETPFKSADPTSTWKPNVRSDKSFHFSVRNTKSTRNKISAASMGGLKRFQKKRGSQTIVRQGNIVQRDDELEFVDERSPRRNKREKHSATGTKPSDSVHRVVPFGNECQEDPFAFPSSDEQAKNSVKRREDIHRVIPLGKSNGKERESFSFPSQSEEKKNDSSSSSLTIKNRTPVTDQVDLEMGANAKQSEEKGSSNNNRPARKAFISRLKSSDTANLPCAPYKSNNPLKNCGNSDKSSERKEISRPQDAIEKKTKQMLDSSRTNSTDKNNKESLHCEHPVEDVWKQSNLDHENIEESNEREEISKDTIEKTKPSMNSFRTKFAKKNCREHVPLEDAPEDVLEELKFKTCKANEPGKSDSKLRPTDNQENTCHEATPFLPPAASVGVEKGNEAPANARLLTQCDSIQEKCSLQKFLLVENPYGEPSSLKTVRKNLDRAMIDEEYGSDYHRNSYHELFNKKSNDKRCQNSSSSPLSRAKLVEMCRKVVQAPETKFIDDTEEELSIPRTSFMRSETQATTEVMGLSPCEVFHRRSLSIDKDLQLENPSSVGAIMGSKSPSKRNRSGTRPSNHHRNTLDLSSSSDSETSTHVDSSNCSRRQYFATPKPKQLVNQFNAIETVAPIKASKRRKIRNNTNGTIRDLERDNSIPKYIFGKTKSKRPSAVARKNDPRVVNHPLRHNSARLDDVIATAISSKKRSTRSKQSLKRNSDGLTPQIAKGKCYNASNIKTDIPTTAFQRRKRNSFGPPRKRTKTMSELSAQKLKSSSVRHVSLSPEKSTVKHPNHDSRSSVNGKDQKQKVNHFHGHKDDNHEDSSDWSDWDSLPIDRNLHKISPPSNADSTNSFLDGFVDDYIADEEDNVPKPKLFLRKAGKKEKSQNQVGPLKPIHSNRRRVVPNRRWNSCNTVKKASIILVLFCIYIVRWAGYDLCNPTIQRKRASTTLDIRKRTLHHIRFSKNPNLSLLQASNGDETATM